jgi:hypothetical protein
MFCENVADALSDHGRPSNPDGPFGLLPPTSAYGSRG